MNPGEGGEVLSVVPERLALSNGCLVADCEDAIHEVSVEVTQPYGDARLRGLANLVPSFLGNLVLPPVLKAGNRDRGDVVPGQGIGVLGCCVWQALTESEEIGSEGRVR